MICCQVPSIGRPSLNGTVNDGPRRVRDAFDKDLALETVGIGAEVFDLIWLAAFAHHPEAFEQVEPLSGKYPVLQGVFEQDCGPKDGEIGMSNLVTDGQPCTEKEKQELLAYLRANSHVQLPVQMMEAGGPLEKGRVKGIPKISRLQTCFANLGNTYSQELHGTEFFSVAQALAVFRNPGEDKHPDIPTDFKKILRYKDQFAGPNSCPIVTIVETQAGMLIADGDKTAIAALLYAQETDQSDFILPVYHVRAPKTNETQR
jgi:hypothetical protein